MGDCAVVGDIYNTMFESTCVEAMPGFRDYAWLFVWCSFVGVLVIIATIVLNVCVGLRPEDDGTPPDQEYEMSGRNNAYLAAHHVPASSPIPASSASIEFVPAAVPPANASTPASTNGKHLYPTEFQ